MKMRFVSAAFAACLMGSAAVLVSIGSTSPALAASGGSAPKVSASVGKLLQGAQKLMAAKDFAGAMALIKQAQALPDQTPIDTYEINDFLAITAFNLNDHATADTAFEAMADSPAMPEGDKAGTLHNAALFAGEAKHYDKVIKYAEQLFALGGPPDPAVLAVLAEAYYHANDYAKAEETAQKAIANTAAGIAPNRGALEIALACQLKTNRPDEALKTLESIVTYYDEPEEWDQLIDVALGTKAIKDLDALNMYRLKSAAHAASTPDDFTVHAALALQNGYPAEAKAVLEEGIAAGKLSNSGKVAAQLADARARTAKDRATLSAFEAAAAKSPNGELDVKLAETLYGYGRHSDVVAAARRGLTKGGAKVDANEANLLIGMAQAVQGNAVDALAALGDIKNGSPAVMKTQRLWSVFVGRKYATASAAH